MPESSVVLDGRVVADLELKHTPGGKAVCTFGLALEHRANSGGEKSTSFVDVTVWEGLAENAADTLRKGDRTIVFGRIKQQSWESRDGEKRSKIIVQAEDVAPSLLWATAVIKKVDDRSDRDEPRRSNTRSARDDDEPTRSRSSRSAEPTRRSSRDDDDNPPPRRRQTVRDETDEDKF